MVEARQRLQETPCVRMGCLFELCGFKLFDDTPGRLAKLSARRPGEPNPFLMSTDKYVKFWTVVSECIRAEVARR